jgi:hypothetical protein
VAFLGFVEVSAAAGPFSGQADLPSIRDMYGRNRACICRSRTVAQHRYSCFANIHSKMATRLPVLRTAPLARARCPIACKPVLDRKPTLHRLSCVRAADAEPELAPEEDTDIELEVDEVQEQRALREDRRQAQSGSQRGGQRRNEEEWEDKIIQVRNKPVAGCNARGTAREVGLLHSHCQKIP